MGRTEDFLKGGGGGGNGVELGIIFLCSNYCTVTRHSSTCAREMSIRDIF